MTEEMKLAIADMEKIADKNFHLVKTHLLSDEKIPLWERAKMMEIAKNSAKMMKYATEMKYGHHYGSDMKI